MKICIPTTDLQGLKSQAHGHFGSAPTFTLIDTETRKTEVVVNQNAHHAHGQCRPASFLQDKGVEFVICRGLGQNALHRLMQMGIQVLLTNETNIERILEQFDQGTLPLATTQTACAGHSH